MVMAELEVDQSHLPQVQEVEQYYSANVQKNQLVQNDIRIARQLQDEEEQQARQSRASRRLEEQDSEYARMIQEEIERNAEETRRREQEDEEMAKRLQEEEEMDIRQQRLASAYHSSTEPFALPEECPSVPAQPCPPLPDCPGLREDESTEQRGDERGIPRGSPGYCESSGPYTRASRGSLPGDGQSRRRGLRLDGNHHRSEGSEGTADDEAVPSYTQGYRLEKIASDGHCHTQHHEDRSLRISRTSAERDAEVRDREDGVKLQRRRSVREEGCPHSTRQRDYGEGGADRHHSHRSRRRECVRSWTYRERGTKEKRVHFKDEGRRYNSFRGDDRGASSASDDDYFRDRREASRQSCRGDLRWARGDGNRFEERNARRRSQFLKRDEPTRCSYGGEFRDRRSKSESECCRERTQSSRNRGYGESHNDFTVQEGRVYQQGYSSSEYSGDDCHPHRHGEGREVEGRGHRRSSRRSTREGGARRESRGERGVRRAESMRWPLQPSSSEEEGGQRGDGRRPDRVQRSSSSFSGGRVAPRARHRGAGGGPPPPGASLELGALRQVLLDEELARRLQEEEERLLAESPQSHPNLEKNEPEGDFRVAQVAQDEEIAHYIQHQERRSQRWSRDLEEEGPWRERRVRGDPCERRTGAERKVSQALRGRLDSEGLNSPGEDCSPEHQPSSPVSTVPPTQPMKNIAEELDPTFKAKRRGSNPSGQTTSGNCQSNSTPLAGVYDYVQEPTFVPPTKRQSSKSARPKAKDKKESCKQQ
ncbi:uncharacterized protein ccdc50b isoform X2 [Scleropages formosus]|uniref:Coiled-coil domain-containing protein 50-like n=1 Tax=Scleropages formosus TaxID=113540 RepID=A0A8C9QVU6_SCLFO|nr:uncharacterized protein LOC108938238 isoform X2 [Scleropages formosus]